MKTAREWFQHLPEPYRTQAMENSDGLKREYKSLSLALECNFKWRKTPDGQGADYWGYVWEIASNGGFDKPNLNGWIPVSERLPEIGEQVLVVGELCNEVSGYYEGICISIGLVYFNSIDTSQCCDVFNCVMWYTKIKFWQPLPKLPEKL